MPQTVIDFLGYDVEKIEYLKKDVQVQVNEPVELKFSCTPSITEKQDKVFVITLSAEITGSFFDINVILSGSFKLNGEDNIFIKQNGMAILYPFLRATVASTCSTAGIPPVILPVVNFANVDEQNDVKNDYT